MAAAAAEKLAGLESEEDQFLTLLPARQQHGWMDGQPASHGSHASQQQVAWIEGVVPGIQLASNACVFIFYFQKEPFFVNKPSNHIVLWSAMADEVSN